MWYLELIDPGKPILFVINSPGGAVDSGFAIWDQVKLITSPVTTLVTGLAASMGSVLSLCAAPGRRQQLVREADLQPAARNRPVAAHRLHVLAIEAPEIGPGPDRTDDDAPLLGFDDVARQVP